MDLSAIKALIAEAENAGMPVKLSTSDAKELVDEVERLRRSMRILAQSASPVGWGDK